MNFEDKEKYYYEFSLKNNFVPNSIPKDFKDGVVARVIEELYGVLAQERFKNDSEFQYNHFKFSFITSDKKLIDKIKSFCHHIMANDILIDLTNEHILGGKLGGSVDLESFHDALKKYYISFSFYYDMDKEVPSKIVNENKRPKI